VKSVQPWKSHMCMISRVPCNEERSERSERDFTVEKSMGGSCVHFYAKPIEVIR